MAAVGLRESASANVNLTDISGASMAPAPLTRPSGHGDYLSHAHRRPPSPSLVAHLLTGGRCDFRQFTSLDAAIAVRRPFVVLCGVPSASFVRGPHEQDRLFVT